MNEVHRWIASQLVDECSDQLFWSWWSGSWKGIQPVKNPASTTPRKFTFCGPGLTWRPLHDLVYTLLCGLWSNLGHRIAAGFHFLHFTVCGFCPSSLCAVIFSVFSHSDRLPFSPACADEVKVTNWKTVLWNACNLFFSCDVLRNCKAVNITLWTTIWCRHSQSGCTVNVFLLRATFVSFSDSAKLWLDDALVRALDSCNACATVTKQCYLVLTLTQAIFLFGLHHHLAHWKSPTSTVALATMW